MSNHYGRNASQARIAAVGVNKETSPLGIMAMAKSIAKTGVGKSPINRAQRRFEEKQARKSAT